MMELGPLLAVPIAVAAAATDLHSGLIPNRLTYPGIVLGLAIGLAPGASPGLGSSLLGLAAGALPALALFSVRAIGGGDVKLLAALGALLGLPLMLELWFYSIVAGWGIAACVVVARGRTLAVVCEFGRFLRALVMTRIALPTPAADLRIPFAVAVLVGVFWTLGGSEVHELAFRAGLAG